MIEVLKLMVEALQTYGDKHRETYLLAGAWDEEITKGDAAIRAGLKAIVDLESQEPVAWADMGTRDVDNDAGLSWTTGHFHTTPLYIHPPQRTWVGLTQSDFNEIYDLFANKVSSDFIFEKMYSTIEAKLKERNI